jgi:hypothetical protein
MGISSTGTSIHDAPGDVLQQAADYCQRSAQAWRCNGYPERAYAAERLAKDLAESAAAVRTAALHSDHIGRNGED